MQSRLCCSVDSVCTQYEPDSGENRLDVLAQLCSSPFRDLCYSAFASASRKRSCVEVPLRSKADPVWKHVRCHDWKGDAIDEGDAVADWLSSFLQQRVRLVKYGGEGQLDPAACPRTTTCFRQRQHALSCIEGASLCLNNNVRRSLPAHVSLIAQSSLTVPVPKHCICTRRDSP